MLGEPAALEYLLLMMVVCTCRETRLDFPPASRYYMAIIDCGCSPDRRCVRSSHAICQQGLACSGAPPDAVVLFSRCPRTRLALFCQGSDMSNSLDTNRTLSPKSKWQRPTTHANLLLSMIADLATATADQNKYLTQRASQDKCKTQMPRVLSCLALWSALRIQMQKALSIWHLPGIRGPPICGGQNS